MGYIEPRYVGAMIDNVEQNGPYIVLSDGFAMPHAAADEGAMKMGMSLIRLSEPVCFGEEEYDPIDLVCCLSTTDSKSHLRAFFNLVNLLRESRFKAALRTAESSEETARVIQLFERRLES